MHGQSGWWFRSISNYLNSKAGYSLPEILARRVKDFLGRQPEASLGFASALAM